jgi:multicomponent Na+:H+ antiporter subunit E
MTARPWNLAAWLLLGILFLRELVLSAWDVVKVTLAPRLMVRPAVVAVKLDVRSDAGITLLADMVTLTPGTTALHVSDDRTTLYIHAMASAESSETVRAIKDRLERPLRRVLP